MLKLPINLDDSWNFLESHFLNDITSRLHKIFWYYYLAEYKSFIMRAIINTISIPNPLNPSMDDIVFPPQPVKQ